MSNILNSDFKYNYTPEPPPQINASEFEKVIRSRRSIRKFTSDSIPEEIVQKVLDFALLAPNSSNLQPWEFYRIKTPETKKKVAYICLNQNAAKTAAELIVCVARTRSWRQIREDMIRTLKEKQAPKLAIDYYEKIVPIAYWNGFLNWFGYIKKLITFFAGIRQPIPREPATEAELKNWATKTTALACENIMLGFRAFGYDTCAMEGFDSWRLRRLLKLSSDAYIVMVIGAGKRQDTGVYGPQIRFARERFIKEI